MNIISYGAPFDANVEEADRPKPAAQTRYTQHVRRVRYHCQGLRVLAPWGGGTSARAALSEDLKEPYARFLQQLAAYEEAIVTYEPKHIPQTQGEGKVGTFPHLWPQQDAAIEEIARRKQVEEELRSRWNAFTVLVDAIVDNKYVMEFYADDSERLYLRTLLLRMDPKAL